MHTRLRTIRTLYRTPSTLHLFGVPYVEDYKGLHNTWLDYRDSSIAPSGWISLEEPNWGETRTAHQRAEVDAFLNLHADSIPRFADEWSVLPPIEVVDAALGRAEPRLLRPDQREREHTARLPGTAGSVLAHWKRGKLIPRKFNTEVQAELAAGSLGRGWSVIHRGLERRTWYVRKNGQ